MEERVDKKFPYFKIVRRITDDKQVRRLFDEPPVVSSGKPIKYNGMIGGHIARLTTKSDHYFYVFVEREEDLQKVYNTLLDRLIGKSPTESRGLGDKL